MPLPHKPKAQKKPVYHFVDFGCGFEKKNAPERLINVARNHPDKLVAGFDSQLSHKKIKSLRQKYPNLRLFNTVLPEGMNKLEPGSVGIANMEFFLQSFSRPKGEADKFLSILSEKMHPHGRIYVSCVNANRPAYVEDFEKIAFKLTSQDKFGKDNRKRFSNSQGQRLYRDLMEGVSKKELKRRNPLAWPTWIDELPRDPKIYAPTRLCFKAKKD